MKRIANIEKNVVRTLIINTKTNKVMNNQLYYQKLTWLNLKEEKKNKEISKNLFIKKTQHSNWTFEKPEEKTS
nr:hypothetical protein [Entomoplasma sp. MP1]